MRKRLHGRLGDANKVHGMADRAWQEATECACEWGIGERQGRLLPGFKVVRLVSRCRDWVETWTGESSLRLAGSKAAPIG
jgi:hypothetical protein